MAYLVWFFGVLLSCMVTAVIMLAYEAKASDTDE